MKDWLRNLLIQRAAIVPLVCLLIGIALHIKGIVVSNEQQALIQQEVAGAFDLIALISGISGVRYTENTQKVETTAIKTNEVVNNLNQTSDPTVPNPPPVAPLDLTKIVNDPSKIPPVAECPPQTKENT